MEERDSEVNSYEKVWSYLYLWLYSDNVHGFHSDFFHSLADCFQAKNASADQPIRGLGTSG